ncbi:MAG: hypothetical protein ACFFCP_15455, partial [Promethearchaeota archaeon]
ITQAMGLTRQISNEWRWLERKRTKLPERKKFLEGAMEKLSSALDTAEPEGEVRQILSNALDEYKKLYSQIDRIVSSYDAEQDTSFTSRDEAAEAIEGLLAVIPKKIATLQDIENDTERELELQRIISALEQAMETANSFKINKLTKLIQTELEKVQPSEVSNNK